MTTETEYRALLEQALESMCWAARVLNIDPDEAPNYHRSLENIRAELAKPVEPATAPKPAAWINGHDLRLLGRQGRGALVWCDNEGNADTPLYLHPPTPAWHDAPTCDGLWMCNEGDDNPYRWTTHRVTFPLNQLLVGEDERWYGPIQQDTKAEGEST